MKYLRLFEDFKKPIKSIRDKIQHIIDNIGHRKGRPFFDALDNAIKDDEIVLELAKGYENSWIASSGGFGDTLSRLYKENRFKCKGLVVFNGKMLTDGLGVNYWYPEDFDLDNKEFVYLDDSYFSGGTSKKISEFLKQYKSSIYEVAVIYDGSETKLDNVHSFYRYWNHRDLQEYKNKKVNESAIDNAELREFCEIYLAHLIDNGYMFNIYTGTVNKSFISIMSYNRYDVTLGEFVYPHKMFDWDDVKDNIIPFMQVLKSEYTINKINFTLDNSASSDTVIRGRQITSLIKDEFILSDKSDIYIITLDINKK